MCERQRTLSLNPSKKPKQMNLKDADEPNNTVLGIYRIDGDTLHFAFSQGNATERPIDFNPYRGLLVLKRKKR
jgi:uncharacterized protein (TIGR03067 family)